MFTPSRPTTRAFTLFVTLVALPAGATTFRYPLADPTALHLAKRGDGSFFIIHVDHDLADSAAANLMCLAFDGARNFPNCYDAHRGTDYLLAGGFETMDAGSLQVVAGADGEVIEAVDGNYDRCHADPATQDISCDGFPVEANHVVLRHADGLTSMYWHLKKGSVLVSVGELVACGQPLGLVGSSGVSSTPHLHFQVEDVAGAWIDPYAGPESQPASLWVAQDGPYGIPAAWCEGESPQWPEAGAEVVEAVESVEAVEAPELMAEVGDGRPGGAESEGEVIDAAVPDAQGATEVSDPQPAGRSVGCQVAGVGELQVGLMLVVGLLGLSILNVRRRSKRQGSMGTN